MFTVHCDMGRPSAGKLRGNGIETHTFTNMELYEPITDHQESHSLHASGPHQGTKCNQLAGNVKYRQVNNIIKVQHA